MLRQTKISLQMKKLTNGEWSMASEKVVEHVGWPLHIFLGNCNRRINHKVKSVDNIVIL